MNSRRLAWLAVAASAVLVALHKPWALQNAQLWAEDGSVFLLDADLQGASSLWRPYAGYLNLVPRAIAWLAGVIADACLWPTLYNAGALLVLVLVLARMASPRLDVPYKAWLILSIALIAHSGEVFLNITNVQWITALLLVLQLLMRPATTALQAVGDVAIVAAAGLTGPFALMLLPFFAWHARLDAWDARDVANGDRYYFLPRVLLAWLLIWQFDSPRRGVAPAAKALCVIGVIAQLPNYVLPAPPDYHWAAYCDRIRQGVAVTVPTLPEGWKLVYPGRPVGAR